MDRRRCLVALAGTGGICALDVFGLLRSAQAAPGSAAAEGLETATRCSWALGAAVDAALVELSTVQRVMSIYRPENELRRLNREGYLSDAHPLLLKVLGHAGAMSGRTDGAFDVTIQPLWDVHSRAKSGGRLPDRSAVSAAGEVVGFRSVEVAGGLTAAQYIARKSVSRREGRAATRWANCGSGCSRSRISSSTWPSGNANAVPDRALGDLISGMPNALEKHVRVLFQQVRSYRERLRELARNVYEEDRHLSPEEERQRERLRQDAILRAKLRPAGYTVVEVAAACLDDTTAVNANLDEIARHQAAGRSATTASAGEGALACR